MSEHAEYMSGPIERPGEPRRWHGLDIADECETLCEATEQPDGTLHLTFVQIASRQGS